MDDAKIVEMYWERNENAIRETERKYGRYLTKIAYNILADFEDSKETINDTYLRAWRSMPPNKPQFLQVYLGKITRRLSIDCFRTKHRRKRSASEYELSLSELSECVAGGNTAEEAWEASLLAQSVCTWLRTLPVQTRTIFIGRYYYLDPVRKIAAYSGLSESNVKSRLHRARIGLRQYLQKEGFII